MLMVKGFEFRKFYWKYLSDDCVSVDPFNELECTGYIFSLGPNDISVARLTTNFGN